MAIRVIPTCGCDGSMSMRYDICTTLGNTPSGGWHAGNFYNGMIKVLGGKHMRPCYGTLDAMRRLNGH